MPAGKGVKFIVHIETYCLVVLISWPIRLIDNSYHHSEVKVDLGVITVKGYSTLLRLPVWFFTIRCSLVWYPVHGFSFGGGSYPTARNIARVLGAPLTRRKMYSKTNFYISLSLIYSGIVRWARSAGAVEYADWTSATCVLDMTLNWIWWWGSSNGILGDEECFLIAITRRFSLIWSDSTYSIPIYVLNGTA